MGSSFDHSQESFLTQKTLKKMGLVLSSHSGHYSYLSLAILNMSRIGVGKGVTIL